MEIRLAKDCPVMDKPYDVLVAGGGTAGIAAATTSAMEGARTLLIEKESFLGGSATGGQVIPMMPLSLDGKDSSFLNTRIKTDMSNMGGRFIVSDNDGWFNPELLKFQHEKMVLEAGADILYDTQAVDCAVENDRMECLFIHNRSGLQAVKAAVYIDCTGDGLLAHYGGAACECGGPDGRNQSMSLRFMVGGVDMRRLIDFLDEIGEGHLDGPALELASLWHYNTPLRGLFYQALQNGDITHADGAYFQAFTVPGMPGVFSFNGPQIPGVYDANDPADYTKISVVGKDMILRLHHFLVKYVKGFENSYIQSVAQPGVRESRRLVGEYVLTAADYAARREFHDGIARTNYPIDIHDDQGAAMDAPPASAGRFLEVPFRSLVTRKVQNLIVAGRCISADFQAHSAIRIQPTCRSTGEAAGIAAAMCVREGTLAYMADGATVRARMVEYGAYL